MRLFICAAAVLALVGLCEGQAGSLYSCMYPNSPCLNGATCNFLDGRCACPFGYERENCRIRTDTKCNALSNLNCGANGQCVSLNGVTQQCSCDAGYSGDRCQIPPMSCQCSSDRMTITMAPPGNFSNGRGNVKNYGAVPACGTTRDVTKTNNAQTMTILFTSTSCGNAIRTNMANGEYAFSRTFQFRHTSLITKFGIDFTCNCVFGQTSGLLYAVIGNIDASNLNNLINVTATGYIAPVSYSLTTSNGVVVRAATGLVIGDQMFLTITADAGFCVMIDSITVNNTLGSTDPRFQEATLLNSGCRTTLGTSVISRELQPGSNFSQWLATISAFLLPSSNRIILTIRYRAYPANDNLCFLPSCGAASGRKKRQAGDETEAETDSTKAGSFSQIIYISDPLAPPQITEPEKQEECSMSSGVLIGLIVMAAIICILLLVCFIVGMRMIMAKKRVPKDTKSPPSYVQ